MRVRSRNNPKRIRRNVTLGKGFPDKLTLKHLYVEEIDIATGAGGSLSNYQFSCNSLYDPNVSSTGHQPLYFDQLTPIYNRYLVIGAKFHVRFIPKTAAQLPMRIALFVDDDTSQTITSFENAIENQKCTYALIPAGSTVPINLTMKWSAKRQYGGSLMANTNIAGTTTLSPTEQTYFKLYWQNLDGTTNVQLYAEVKVEYIAVWFDRRELASS